MHEYLAERYEPGVTREQVEADASRLAAAAAKLQAKGHVIEFLGSTFVQGTRRASHVCEQLGRARRGRASARLGTRGAGRGGTVGAVAGRQRSQRRRLRERGEMRHSRSRALAAPERTRGEIMRRIWKHRARSQLFVAAALVAGLALVGAGQAGADTSSWSTARPRRTRSRPSSQARA